MSVVDGGEDEYEGGWDFHLKLFHPEEQIIAHPCYPFHPCVSLSDYVKKQARPAWLREGNVRFEAFFWARCRYDTHEDILWRDIRTFVLDREPDANVDVVVPRSICSFLRQEAEHQSKQPGTGARLIILDYSYVRRLLQLDAHHDRDDIRDLVRRRLPELDPRLCPLQDAQFVCTYEVDGVKGVVWFPLGYAWQKHRVNVHEAEAGGEPNVDIPEVTDRGTYADFLSHRAIIHLDPRPCAILLRDNSDLWNDDRCDAAVSQAANAVSCIIEMLAFDIRTDAVAAGSEPTPFNFVDDAHYMAVREDFSRPALSVGFEDYSYNPQIVSIPQLLFLLGQRDAHGGGCGMLDAWVNDDLEAYVTALFERASAPDFNPVTTFGNLLLGAHLHGVALDEVVSWPGLLALSTDARRRAFYADEPQAGAFQEIGVGFGLYRGYRRDLLWASIYQELVRRDKVYAFDVNRNEDEWDLLYSAVSLNTSRVEVIKAIIQTYVETDVDLVVVSKTSDLQRLDRRRTSIAIFDRVWNNHDRRDVLFHCFAAVYIPGSNSVTFLHPMAAWRHQTGIERSADVRSILEKFYKQIATTVKVAIAPAQAAVGGGGFMLARMVLDIMNGAGDDSWRIAYEDDGGRDRREMARAFWTAHRSIIFDWAFARILRHLENVERETYVKVREHGPELDLAHIARRRIAEKNQGYGHLDHEDYNGDHEYKRRGREDVDNDEAPVPVPAKKRRLRGG